ncbi:MAG TPA: hypothetical protein VGF17_27000, partial [Phytomonospora sp.]
ITREYMYIDDQADELVRLDDRGDEISRLTTRYEQGREIIGLQTHADGEYYCLVTKEVNDPIGDFVRSPNCATLAEPDDDGWNVVTTGSADPHSVLPVFDEGWLVRETAADGTTMRFAKYDEDGTVLWTEPEHAGLSEYRLLAWRLKDW